MVQTRRRLRRMEKTIRGGQKPPKAVKGCIKDGDECIIKYNLIENIFSQLGRKGGIEKAKNRQLDEAENYLKKLEMIDEEESRKIEEKKPRIVEPRKKRMRRKFCKHIVWIME